jgi:type VI secretion system secreted protein Hcp
MGVAAFLSFFDKAEGESTHKGKEKWVELQSWDWEVEAESSWTKGGGASVGKPNPGSLTFEHMFDTSSIPILGYICTGKAFPKVELQMAKTSGRGTLESYFSMTMEGLFIVKAAQAGTADGNIAQRVSAVFKTVRIEYKPSDTRTGAFGAPKTFTWDIPAGTASPSA